MQDKVDTGQQEEEVFSGRLFEVVHQEQVNGRNFEIARRAPGVRLIIADREQGVVLLTREFRPELNDWDYRLPGGKVFDELEEYKKHRQTGGDIMVFAEQKARAEGREEAGVIVEDLKFFKNSVLGATVEWDLYVFEATKWRQADGQALEEGEVIETDNWFTYQEAETMALEGEIQEERMALALLQWLKKQKKIEFNIRIATASDTEAIRRVQAESWRATYSSKEHGVSEEWVRERTDSWLTPERLEESKTIIEASTGDPRGFYRVAEHGGEIVGFVHASTLGDSTKELSAIYVHPSMFGKGLGHKLISQALDWAGQAKMSLEVAIYNNRAIDFYQSHGFKAVEGTEYTWSDKIPVIKMEREITNEI